MGNLLKSKEVASVKCKLGVRSLMCTRNEVNYGETDLTKDEIILIRVAKLKRFMPQMVLGCVKWMEPHVKFE
ncbi:hypothetical protein Bca52824_087580 [Brassica carinata]|uniref:Uncharacterized protein n=1 Tax=Brassica carinata TaxID=52824 RepID=A0A8X7TN41_BRACI|nr:hypothetical protein Bca52824_087580 [Brassica carinata]